MTEGPISHAESIRRACSTKNLIAAARIKALHEADDFFRWAEATRRAFFVFNKQSLKALRK